MTHPRTRTGRSLAGLVLILFGLSTYGCGDTGTATEPAELGSLSVSPGSLQPAFNPATTSYTATVSSNITSTTITASPRVAGDRIQIDNQQTTSQTVTLESPGTEKSVNIVVTETGTGGTSKSYTVRVKREVEDTTLATLSVSPGTLAPSTFDKDTPDYTVNDIGNGITSVTISATKSNPNTVMQIDSVTVPAGTPSGQATVRLGTPGSTTKVSIDVTAQGGSKNTYTVTINRGASDNSFLRSLSIVSGSTALSLVPRFSQAAPDYTVNVASSIGSTSVTARLDDATARMTVNGVDTNSGQARTVTLNPAGQNPSPTPILIVVTAQNGSRKTYTVNVIRAALGGNNKLSALTISPGSLDFNPDSDTLTYTVNVGSGVSNVAVSATKADRTATMSQDVTAPAGTATGRATIALGGPGSTTPVVINVTAPNGTSKTYRINVVREALGGNNNLQNLTVTSHTLSPTFSQTRTRTDYELEVGSNVESVTVTATPQDGAASVRFLVNNALRTNPISLPPGPSTTEIEIVVRAPNSTEKSYFISASRDAPSSNANLSELRLTAGSSVTNFSPPFASNTVTVTPEIGEVVVRATKDDPNATMAIGSTTVPPGTSAGQATFTLNGAGGEPTTISFTVTPQSGVNPKTYTISVIRPAAPTAPDKPATAPDLITADDSCPLDQLDEDQDGITDECFSGSNDDNITTVKRPGFSVPTPTSGETVTVYIRKTTGEEFPSSSTSAGSTLIFKPNTDLPDGLYDVTYTLSNSVGESVKSDPMNPQLQINTIINN